MIVCTGQGGGNVGGGHCCWIAGVVCEFLFTDRGGTPRCKVWDEMDTDKWRKSPAGRFMATLGDYTCQDWPQNIPEVMAEGIGLCCYRSDR